MSYLTFNRYSLTLHPQILWIINHQIGNSKRICLGSYAILKPNVNWCNIDMSDFDLSKQCLFLNISELSKSEVINQIKVHQPNIIIFAGTFKKFEHSEMENIG